MGSDNPVTFRSGDDLVKASRRCVITERLIPRRIIGLSLDPLQDAYPICEKKALSLARFFYGPQHVGQSHSGPDAVK